MGAGNDHINPIHQRQARNHRKSTQPTNTPTFPIDASVDAFWRRRVSEPITIFDVKHLFDKQPILYDELVVSGGSASHLIDEGAVSLDVTSTAGSRIVRQSKRYIPYQPGKSRLGYMTGNLARGGIVPGIRSRIGIFDNHDDKDTPTFPGGGNGHFFEVDENGNMGVVERSFVTGAQIDTRIEQSNWNVDKFDGSGPSGIVFNLDKAQVFVIDWSWLGAGAARMGFMIGRKIYLCHIFDHGNKENSSYMGTSTLPIRYELENISASAAGKMTQICSTIQSEGGFNPRGKIWEIDRGVTSVSIGQATFVPVISLRTKASHNRVTLNPTNVHVLTKQAGATYNWIALIGPTLTGASFSSVDSDSSAEFDIAATAVSGGKKVGGGYFTEKANVVSLTQFENTILAAADIAGERDIVTIAAKRADVVGMADVWGGIQWQEWD